ncbi:MAG: hypothetical protein ABIG87_03105 [Patescibacteria group bacterium]
MSTKQILKWPLIVGIVIVLNLFFLYAIKVAYPKPEYNDFCVKEQVIKKIVTQAECLEVGRQWNENVSMKERVTLIEPTGEIRPDLVVADDEYGYCNQQFICSQQFDTAREDYERNVFIALIIFGVVSVVIGFMTMGKEVVSIALSLGGVLSFIIASVRYWQYASDWLHLAILGVALAVLIYLGIKKFTEELI